MTATEGQVALCELAGAAHVCWVVDDHDSYVDQARGLLARDREAGRKPVAFGPQGTARDELGSVATVSLDPHLAILDGGPLEPEKMFAAFREQTALARSEGFGGLCVVADMDWLLPAQPTTDDIVTFEALLDKVVTELDATVVCAYRRSTFDTTTIAGTLAVHPHDVGSDEAPQFRLVAGKGGVWHLSGEIDLAVTSHFAAALAAVLSQPGSVIDVTNLDFIDVLGMGIIAEASRNPETKVRLRDPSGIWHRTWHLAGFDDYAPTVQFLT